MKMCASINCEETKPQPELNFGKGSKFKDGLNCYCKKCANRINRKKWNSKSSVAKQKVMNKIAIWQRKNKNKLKAWNRKGILKRYNLTLDQFRAMEVAQNNKCGICGMDPEFNPENGSKINFAVDHNHITGKVRGLLCRKCNHFLGLGKADEGDILFRKAIEYLGKNE